MNITIFAVSVPWLMRRLLLLLLAALSNWREVRWLFISRPCLSLYHCHGCSFLSSSHIKRYKKPAQKDFTSYLFQLHEISFPKTKATGNPAPVYAKGNSFFACPLLPFARDGNVLPQRPSSRHLRAPPRALPGPLSPPAHPPWRDGESRYTRRGTPRAGGWCVSRPCLCG